MITGPPPIRIKAQNSCELCAIHIYHNPNLKVHIEAWQRAKSVLLKHVICDTKGAGVPATGQWGPVAGIRELSRGSHRIGQPQAQARAATE